MFTFAIISLVWITTAYCLDCHAESVNQCEWIA